MLQAIDVTTDAAVPHTGATLWLVMRMARKRLTWDWFDTAWKYLRSKTGPLWIDRGA